MKKIIIYVAGLLIIGVFCLWVFLFEPYHIQTRTIDIGLKNVSLQAQELKIVQISDIHFKTFNRLPRKLIEMLTRLKPDYLLITGDIINWDVKDLEGLKDFLHNLNNVPIKKTFAVFGNHEYLSRKFHIIEGILNDSGIEFLHNRNVFLDEEINLVGVDDPHLELDDLAAATKGIQVDFPTICLAHSPEIFSRFNIKNSLVLSGHTHGGQIGIPFLVNLISPLRHDKVYLRGLFEKEESTLYVNQGIGTTFIPIRLNSFPEITIVELKEK